MLLRIVTDLSLARESVLRRRQPEERLLPPSIRAQNRRIFGADLDVGSLVAEVIRQVRADGDAAVRRFTREFDRCEPESIVVPQEAIERAWVEAAPDLRDALNLAANRIRRFHERAMPRSWIDFDGESTFGQVFRPLARVAVYAPGGRAVYPSTVLMTAIPARVAGVTDLVLCTPPASDGLPNPVLLAAARAAGVDQVLRIGGAQAVAALAYGTAAVRSVDKIVGPGNVFVAEAKRQVYGVVGIDQIAGPTETLLIADDSASPAALASDLIAQAEHDPMASALLIVDRIELADAVAREVERQVASQPRREIIRDSLEANGAAIVAPSLDVAVDLANAYAPEHLCLATRDPWALVPRVQNAGGIFVGERSIEAIGDYVAGPSHVMPTGGSARFSSALGVLDFLKVMSVFDVAAATFRAIAPAGIVLAEAEGLAGHAAAMRLRQGSEKG